MRTLLGAKLLVLGRQSRSRAAVRESSHDLCQGRGERSMDAQHACMHSVVRSK